MRNEPNGSRDPLGVGRDNAALPDPASSHENAPSPSRPVHAMLGDAAFKTIPFYDIGSGKKFLEILFLEMRLLLYQASFLLIAE